MWGLDVVRWLPLRQVALAAGLLASSAAQAAGPFDGTWTVIFTCPGAADGTAGYTRNFLASVQNGLLHGEIGVRDQAGFLALDGPIPPDGNAVLTGRGLTGRSDYAVGRPSPATPYAFHLQARFAGTHGTGSRVETRRCDAVFSKN